MYRKGVLLCVLLGAFSPVWAAIEPGRATPQPYGRPPAVQTPALSPAPYGHAPLLRGPGAAPRQPSVSPTPAPSTLQRPAPSSLKPVQPKAGEKTDER
ncbi:hypothetical protein HNP49_002879 [Pseudomonas fluvialis]|uniref:Lipoprotein n=1 Tax=Pseudomonas fluvialis TaxID=1793966 RepID=A0A7X0BU40_9PSED|nr:hypothetical protein [Pseudomonas fluvialis]MBB6342697.1 hypothetical protein [Pseudomonas fluvialis]